MKTDSQKKQLLERFKKTPIVQVACEKIGINRSTYYRWCKQNNTFRKQAEEALSEGAKLVNDMAESQLIAGIREQNLTAIIFWLKHHHRTYRTQVELSGRLETNENPLTPTQEKLIKKALEMAYFSKPNILNPKNHDQS